MNNKYAMLIAFLITGLIASDVYLFSLIKQSPPYSITITRVIDGDTFETSDNKTIRLLNINTPEKNTPGSDQATSFLKQYQNTSILLEITGIDKYQRSLARAYTQNQEYLNLKIIKQGLATKFLVDETELSIFSKAEQQAIQNQIGIWQHSEHINCIDSEIDKTDEIVVLKNSCQPINLNEWFLKDESRKILKFKNIEIQKKLLIHTTLGASNSTDIFWNQKTDVWNNDRDTLYLFDNENKLVHFNSYGY